MIAGHGTVLRKAGSRVGKQRLGFFVLPQGRERLRSAQIAVGKVRKTFADQRPAADRLGPIAARGSEPGMLGQWPAFARETGDRADEQVEALKPAENLACRLEL